MIAPPFLAEQRFERNVASVHALGARPLAELLKEIGSHLGCPGYVEHIVAGYAGLDRDLVAALRGDRFAPQPLHLIDRGAA